MKRPAWLRFLHRQIRAVVRPIFPRSLTSGERDFITENARFWRDYAHPRGERYLLVAPVGGHPVISLSDASFVAIAAHARGLRLLSLLYDGHYTTARRMMLSYGQVDFEYITGPRRLGTALLAGIRALNAFRSIKTREDVLKLKIDDVPFGDIVYDTVLNYGYATVDRIDGRVFRALFSCFYYRRVFLRLLRKYPVEAVVMSQLMDRIGGVLAKCALLNGIEVISRVGSYQILLRKYRKLGDMGSHPMTPTPEHFAAMWASRDTNFEADAERYLDRRMRGDVDALDAVTAYRSKRIFTNRLTFCDGYGLDASKPIVFAMMHAFNDWPHWNYPKRHLYTDYYDWFTRTLSIAGDVPGVNWVFKEHPCAAFYPTSNLDLEAAIRQLGAANIRFIPGDADFSTSSLRFVADVVVTAMSTAGLELSAFGIPAVLAAEGAYSGFGFTIEPGTAEAYEEQLRHVAAVPRLTSEQVRAAQLVGYFYFCILAETRYHFCPFVEHTRISGWRQDYTNAFWAAAADAFRNHQAVRALRAQVDELAEFVRDPERIQYVDLERFPIFAVATAGAASVEESAVVAR